MRGVIATLLLAGATQLPPAAPPPRDGVVRDTATTTATGVIRGRVTDRESGEPISRVLVNLVPDFFGEEAEQSQSVRDRRESLMTLTSADGRFEYKRVPAGAYVVVFDPEMRGTHLRQYFGAAEPAESIGASRPSQLQLKDGEVRNDVNGALWRSLAVEGRVVDERGEPMANIEVSAYPWDGPARIQVISGRSTDDRGAFRLFGLPPGQFRICATPVVYFRPAEDSRERSVRTCYPAATVDADADPVVLAATEVGGIDIRVQRRRAYRIMGIAIDSSGALIEDAYVNLVSIGKDFSSSSGVEMQPDGHFVGRDVTPGEYAVQVEIGSRHNPTDKRETERGYALIRVDTADVEGIVVTTTRLAKVAGRIIFEGAALEKFGDRMRVSAETSLALKAVSQWEWPSVEVRNDFTFELTGLLGPQIITVTGQPTGWVVKSVKYREDDVTDTPVEFKTSTDPAALEITMTRRAAVVSGRVLDAQGKGTEAAYVSLIWADPARRQFARGPVKTARPKLDGSFTLGTVRAGEYVILAVPPETTMYQPYPDEEELGRFVRAGERIVLVEGEKREIDLRVVKPR